MTGLADAYSDDVGALQSSSRLKAGVALLTLGAVLGLAALVVTLANPTEWGARRLAGVLGGLAAPALAGGVVVILPASRRLRAAAAIGASLTVLGVAMFWQAYPDHWLGHGRELTPYVTGIYFLGTLTILVCLFAGIATFKRRNDPGGTVSMMVGQGETKIVRVREDSSGSIGGIGLLGGTPDGEVETQTNRPDQPTTGTESSESTRSGTASTTGTRGSSGTGSSASSGTGTSASSGTARSSASTTDATSTRTDQQDYEVDDGSSVFGGSSSGSSSSGGSKPGILGANGAVSDGGSDAETLESPEPASDAPSEHSPSLADRYCGNCEHFQYVRTEQGMTPYCGLNAQHMDDMEACDDWSPNA